jgi:NAD(P)-dependent dehydrogenase (short-subunit alcohol dehydrogenase family)
MRLDGKVALVTGAGSDIGRAIAERLGADGARLALTGRGPEFAELPVGASYAAGDLCDEAFVRDLVARIRVTHGRLDVLVNCVGKQYDSDLRTTDPEDARAVLDANIVAPLLAMKHGIPLMLESGGGSVVNIASRLGIVAIPGQTVYSAAKGGLIMLSKGAALDFAGQGIRVNVVAPGLTATSRVEASFERQGDAAAVRRAREAVIPMRRLATPQDVAEAVAFLASDAAAYITGTVLPVDGGYTAG